MEKFIRRRVNVSTSVKGVHTFEATIEIENGTEEEILAASSSIVAKLDKAYPIIEIKGG